MSSITDYITIAAFLYFFFRGARRGFLRTLLAPLSLAAGCFAGYVYYQRTGNMIIGLGICIFGPFAINVLASILLHAWNKSVDEKAGPSSISRVLGSILSVLWSGSYLALTLVLIGITPLKIGWLEKAQADVLSSKTYALLTSQITRSLPDTVPDIKKIVSVLQDPEKLGKFRATDEFKDLYEDESVETLISDEEIAELIKKQDYGALLANPKMQGALQNEELLKKIFALNKRIMEGAPEGELDNVSASAPMPISEPRIIEIRPE